MEKRSEMKKIRKQRFQHRLKQTAAIVLCLAFMVSLIRMTDLSTRRMMMSKDDRYAIGMSILEDDLLRVDIVGESFRFDISPVVRLKDEALSQTKEYGRQLSEYVKSQLE